MTERPGAVVVRHSAGYHVFLWTALPLLGVLAGWTLSRVPDWVDGLSWIPFQGPIELLDQVTGRVGTIVLLAVGALVGAAVALTAYDEIIRVEIDPERVTISRGDDVTVVERSSVGGVFTDGKDLVLTGPTGAEVARKTSDLEAKKYEQAFTAMGYPWHDGDPFAGRYTRWVSGMSGLPAGADAYLQARQHALDKNDKDDARDLRAELAALGVVVKDVKKKQHWRLAKSE